MCCVTLDTELDLSVHQGSGLEKAMGVGKVACLAVQKHPDFSVPENTC